MAHFAQLDDNNQVTAVIVVHNNELIDASGQESEAQGIAFCQSLYGSDTRWVQTSYNANFRGSFAGIGSSYDAVRGAFIPPRPYQSWQLDETTCLWNPPVPRPEDDGKRWDWDEATLSWAESSGGI